VKPESRLIARVHRNLTDVHYEKNHNMFRGGTPDVFYSGYGGSLWVEYKWIPNTPVRGLSSGLSALQRHWIFCRAREGVNVWVAIGCPGGIAKYCGTAIFEQPLSVAIFKAKLLSVKEFATTIRSLTGSKHALTREESSVLGQ